MSFLKRIGRGRERSGMIRLAQKAMDDPSEVLRKLDSVTDGIGSDDFVVRTLSAYILYRMAREDLNEEVRHHVGMMSSYLAAIDNADRFSPANIRCLSCMKTVEVNPPVFPKKLKCPHCGKVGRVMIPPANPVGWRLSELYWTVSFLFRMARKGHIEGIETAADYLDSLKDHPDGDIRKRSRMISIMISEGAGKSG
ncbi:MAG: hypothetical protein ACMUIG_00230 [Thermoplasmatota archaeon]